jgi:hypothetical protein
MSATQNLAASLNNQFNNSPYAVLRDAPHQIKL